MSMKSMKKKNRVVHVFPKIKKILIYFVLI